MIMVPLADQVAKGHKGLEAVTRRAVNTGDFVISGHCSFSSVNLFLNITDCVENLSRHLEFLQYFPGGVMTHGVASVEFAHVRVRKTC